jgi:hypothetical protein
MIIYTPTSRNTTTGNVPSAWIGSTREEIRSSCTRASCPYLNGSAEGIKCYAWHGTPALAFASIARGYAQAPERYSLEYALRHSSRDSSILRMSAMGDPSAIPEEESRSIIETCSKNGMIINGYTAGWRLAPWWRGILRASCHTARDEEEARSEGWTCTRVFNPGESSGFVCPNKTGARVTCNTCNLCSTFEDTIWFPHHGSSSRKGKNHETP